MNKEFPCKCGHPSKSHERLAPRDQFDCCVKCMAEAPEDIAYCHDYKQDNLRFLEIKSAKK